MNPIGVEQSGGRTSSRLVKAPIPGDGNSGGVRVVARREGLSKQRREGHWRSPERAKTGLNSREVKQAGAPETGGSGRSSADGQESITCSERRACGSAGEPNRHDCKVMASQEAKNAWTYVGAEERAKERSNVRATERKGRPEMADFQPYWGKPTVRMSGGGGGNVRYGLAVVCHDARKSGNNGSRWPQPGAPPPYSTHPHFPAPRFNGSAPSPRRGLIHRS